MPVQLEMTSLTTEHPRNPRHWPLALKRGDQW
jgi:hypothetical protein